MPEKITACFLCPCNCGLVMTLDESGKITKVKGDKENPRTKGFLCIKGINLADHIDSPHRLSAPQRREDGSLAEVSWDEALDNIARELLRIKNKYGPRSIAMVLGGSAHPMVPNMLAFSFLKSLGSRNMYSPISLEFTSKYLANQKMFGCSYFEGHPDVEHANFVLLIGTNPVLSHPLMTSDLKKLSKDPERTLAVIDPRRTETAQLADIYTPINPSTDVYFLLAMLQVIISEKLYDAKFTDKYSNGLDEVAKSVARFTPEAIEEITGIPAATTREISHKFTGMRPGMIHYDMGVIANRHSTILSWAAKTLTLLNANYGVKGGRLFNPTLVNHNRIEKFAFSGEGYTSRVRDYHEITGHMPVTVLQDEILTPGPGQIRAAIVQGCNPLRSYSNAAKMERAFKDLELVVSIDPFLTEVGRLAHYVLPTCSFHEQENISFGFHELYPTRFVQLTQKIRDPRGQSRPEWTIYRDLCERMDVNFADNAIADMGFRLAEKLHKFRGKPGELNRQESILKLIAKLGGTSYKELQDKPHGFSLTDGKYNDMMAEIRTKDKKARLAVPEFLAAVDGLVMEKACDPEYPFILSTTCRNQGNLNTLYQNEKWLEKHMPENGIIMHPDDAQRHDLIEESRVRLASRTGSDEAAISFSEDVMPGTIYLRGGWGIYSRDPENDSGKLRGTAAAMFVPDDEGDAFTGMPFLSGVPCRVEKT